MPSFSGRSDMRVSFRLLIAAGVLTLGTASATRAGAQARTDTTLTIDRNATVEVSGWSGDVTVTTGGDRALRVRGDDARFDVRGSSRSLLIDANGRRGRGTGPLDLVVPRGTTLFVRTQSGNITVRGTDAEVEASTISGDVRVEEAARVRIETVVGDVTLRGVRDGAIVSATSGDVRLTGVEGDVQVTGTSGTVVLRDVTSRRVAVRIASGDVDWAGAFIDDGRYDFSAHSGNLRFDLPRDARATLDVRTFNGELASGSLPLTLVPDPSDAERQREREADRVRIRVVRDSLQRVVADSMRRTRDRSRSGDARSGESWERDVERSVERMVEGLVRGLSAGVESFAAAFADAGDRGRSQRFTLGRDGGARVSVSTFSGDIQFRSSAAARRE
jgi:hypothetical protein